MIKIKKHTKNNTKTYLIIKENLRIKCFMAKGLFTLGIQVILKGFLSMMKSTRVIWELLPCIKNEETLNLTSAIMRISRKNFWAVLQLQPKLSQWILKMGFCLVKISNKRR